MTATPAQRTKLKRRIETAPLIPSEHDEQVALFKWAALRQARYPELALMFAIPNGGARHPAVAAKLLKEGVKAGVPDICLPVARGGFHGLFIELKRLRGGTASQFQRAWILELTKKGFVAEICRGCDAAIVAIESYLRG